MTRILTSAMAAPARFLFDTDFAAPPAKAEPAAPPVPTIELSVHETLLKDAEERGYARGLKAGREAEEARAAQRLADEAARLAAAGEAILSALDGERRRLEAEAFRLAEAVGRKIAGRLIETHPREAVLAVVSEALAPLRKAPHLVVRLADQDAEAIRGELKTIASERGFEGRLVVLGEPDVAPGDCRIEWADGGIVRDRAAIEAAIAVAIDTHLSMIGATDDPAPDATDEEA